MVLVELAVAGIPKRAAGHDGDEGWHDDFLREGLARRRGRLQPGSFQIQTGGFLRQPGPGELEVATAVVRGRNRMARRWPGLCLGLLPCLRRQRRWCGARTRGGWWRGGGLGVRVRRCRCRCRCLRRRGRGGGGLGAGLAGERRRFIVQGGHVRFKLLADGGPAGHAFAPAQVTRSQPAFPTCGQYFRGCHLADSLACPCHMKKRITIHAAPYATIVSSRKPAVGKAEGWNVRVRLSRSEAGTHACLDPRAGSRLQSLTVVYHGWASAAAPFARAWVLRDSAGQAGVPASLEGQNQVRRRFTGHTG